jgi:hypothetical protein
MLYKFAQNLSGDGMTMTKIRNIFLATTFLIAFGGFQTAAAAIITTTLGNTTPGFNDGDTPTVFPQLVAAQSGQPAPFNAGKGNEIFANLSESWTFNYAAITDTILSASLTLGIADHDSAASGSQVALYEIDGNSLTSGLDTAFEAGGGSGDGEYNIYSLSLAAGFLADLADGSALVMLGLQGPGLQTCTLQFNCPTTPVPAVSETGANGAYLIFSTLTIEYQDSTIPAVPIPAAAPLFLSAIAAFGLYRRRVLRNQA